MKIWMDILTPKQLLFSEPIIQKLKGKNKILCTSRSYHEVEKLSKIRNFDLITIGKHGGGTKSDKLEANLDRMKKLYPMITKFSPDLTISFCSPEAARISFGLGIRHIAFSDSPHAEAVMRLTLPLIQKLFVPWIIPKKEFTKYGIDSKNIIPYRAIDAAVTTKRKSTKQAQLGKTNKKRILIRMEEEKASYATKTSSILPIIEKIVNEFKNTDVVVLGRYDNQVSKLKKLFGKKIKIIKMSFDGKFLLENSDVFIGSGGTMTAESAFMGLPTISYNAVPNLVEKYLVKNNLVKRETNSKKIVELIRFYLQSNNNQNKKRAKIFLEKMENPIEKLIELV